MSWKNKKILITGAAGFIGSHLTERLAKQCSSVRVFIRYNSRNDWGLLEDLPRKFLNNLEIVSGDLKDEDAVNKAMKGIDVVFHLAALIGIPYSYVHPKDVFETNTMATFNVLNAALEQGVGKIVHTSTSEVYGTAKYAPIDENHPLQGQSPYSASKIGADKVAESYYKSFKLPVATIRPFNTYGPRQSARAVIPTIISQVLTQKKIKLGSLSPKRDFTYVEDTVNAFIKIAETEQTIGEVINVGSGAEISIKELFGLILKLTGKQVEVDIDTKRVRPKDSEVGRLIADNSKAKKILKWQPVVPLKEGLKRTIEWFEQQNKACKEKIYNI